MGFELISLSGGLIECQAAAEIVSCNTYTEEYGLFLTQTQAEELVETRSRSLRDTGRLEFGGGATEKIIRAFCDSPYISIQDYAPILNELTEIFYYYKNETLDLMSDDDLIACMKTAFDGSCQGSLDLLAGRELYHLAENLRFGRPFNWTEEAYPFIDDAYEDEQEDDDEPWY